MVTITKFERRSTEGTVALALGGYEIPGRSGFDAIVELDGARYHCSRLDGETEWVVDAYFAAGRSMPTFMNGWGSRCTRLQMAGPAVAAALYGAEVEHFAQVSLEADRRLAGRNWR